MDVTRLAADAGQFLNRAVQYTGETLGQADRTELEPGLEQLLALADATKTSTDKILSQTEVLLQPNPGTRLEDRLYEQLDWRIPPRPGAHELLGDQMIQAGLEMGPNTPYGKALLRCGEAQKQLGEAGRKFVQSTTILFLNPLRNFTEAEYRSIQDERRTLLNKRLDLDVAKARLKRAHEAEREATNLDVSPVGNDYLSQVSFMFSFLRVRWLKMWAQEISQAEMELRICESLFRRQSEVTRQVVEGISHTHNNHMQTLTDFVEAQASYFHQCHQHAQELQKHLASIPAVLCSNNWQSADVGQQPSGHGAADQPSRLSPVSAIHVHPLPEFDQDSWTLNAPPETDKTRENPQPLDLPNNNNNNNNNNNSNKTLTRGQRSAAGQASEADSMSPPRAAGSTPGHAGTPAATASNEAAATLTTGGVEPPASRGEDVQESSSSGDVLP